MLVEGHKQVARCGHAHLPVCAVDKARRARIINLASDSRGSLAVFACLYHGTSQAGGFTDEVLLGGKMSWVHSDLAPAS